MSEELQKRAYEERNVLEELAEAIPGYRSYRERERRRDVDQALRNFIVQQLEKLQNSLRSLNQTLLKRGQLDWLGEVDLLHRQLETIKDKLRFAAYGYTGFFDAIKIKDAELQLLYQFDYALHEQIQKLAELLPAAEQVGDSTQFKERISALTKAVESLAQRLEERKQLILKSKGL